VAGGQPVRSNSSLEKNMQDHSITPSQNGTNLPYEKTASGGLRFKPGRKIGDVRIPNYVYDLWLPVLGMDAIGLYAVYCRLERNDTCKGLGQQRLARLLRIGTTRLANLNEILEDCGFIKIEQPSGYERVIHYTATIVVLDPPEEVPAEAIVKYGNGLPYGTFKEWLVEDSTLSQTGTPHVPKQERLAYPNGNVRNTQMGTPSLGTPSNGNPHTCIHESTNDDASQGEPEPAPKPKRDPPNVREVLTAYFGRLPYANETRAFQAQVDAWIAEDMVPTQKLLMEMAAETRDDLEEEPITVKPLVVAIARMANKERERRKQAAAARR
jgi:hypothetical protein